MAVRKITDGTAPVFDLVGAIAEIETRMADFEAAELELMTEFAARWLLGQIGLLDPRWQRLIEAARIETRRSDPQLLGSWIARVLENGQHLNAPSHPYFEPGASRLVEKACERCGKMFMPSVAGQRFDTNECGTAYFNEHRAD